MRLALLLVCCALTLLCALGCGKPKVGVVRCAIGETCVVQAKNDETPGSGGLADLHYLTEHDVHFACIHTEGGKTEIKSCGQFFKELKEREKSSSRESKLKPQSLVVPKPHWTKYGWACDGMFAPDENYQNHTVKCVHVEAVRSEDAPYSLKPQSLDVQSAATTYCTQMFPASMAFVPCGWIYRSPPFMLLTTIPRDGP